MLVAAGFGGMQIAGSDSRTDRPAGVVGALLGGALILGSLWLMAHNYSDPYTAISSGPTPLPCSPSSAMALILAGLLWSRRRRARGLNPDRAGMTQMLACAAV